MKNFATLILLFLACANNHSIADNKVKLIDHEMTDQTEAWEAYSYRAQIFKFLGKTKEAQSGNENARILQNK